MFTHTQRKKHTHTLTCASGMFTGPILVSLALPLFCHTIATLSTHFNSSKLCEVPQLLHGVERRLEVLKLNSNVLCMIHQTWKFLNLYCPLLLHAFLCLLKSILYQIQPPTVSLLRFNWHMHIRAELTS